MVTYKKGDTAYINDTVTGWVKVKVKIIHASGNYYTVKRLDRSDVFDVPGHRLLTENEYLALIDRIRTIHPVRTFSSARNSQYL